MNKLINYILITTFFLSVFFIKTGYVEAVSCKNTRPGNAPDLFQIDATKNSAKLYFTPVNNNVTGYTIVYGLERGVESFGASFSQGPYGGVLTYDINFLNSDTTYYFRVRADNGCKPGKWSNSMSIQTKWNSKIYTKYKSTVLSANISNLKPTIVKKVPKKIEDPLFIEERIKKEQKPTLTITQAPKLNIIHVKKKENIIEIFKSLSKKIISFMENI